MEERSYRRRQIVYFSEQKNDYIFMLVSGRVKLLKIGASGREVTLDIVSPGELFGEANILVANSPYESSAEVLEDSVVLAMRRTGVAAMIMDNIAALREFSALEVSRRHAAEQRLAEFVFYDVPTRLAHLLGQLASFYASGSGSEVLIKAKLTHQELANLVGSTRETTTLILNDFKRRKLIEFQGRKIVVLAQDALSSFDSHSGAGSPVVDADDAGLIGGRFASHDDDSEDDDDDDDLGDSAGSDGVATARRKPAVAEPVVPKKRGRPRIVRSAD